MAIGYTPTTGGVKWIVLVVRGQEGNASQSRFEHESPKEFFQNRKKPGGLNP
jgi:hypothetical protein